MVKELMLLYAIWGFNWVVMKEATHFFSPLLFTSYRFLTAAVILLLVNVWLRLPLPPRSYWKWIAVTGILQVSFNIWAVQMSLQFLDAGLAAVLNYSMPVWMAILAYIFLGEPLTRRKVIAIIICMAGMCVLLDIRGGGNAFGMLMAVSSAAAWASAGIIIKIQDRKQTGEKCGMVQYTTWQIVIGTVMLWICTYLFEPGTAVWNLTSVGCVLYNGLMASAVAFFLWNYILVHMEAGKASVAVLGVPVVGVLCGIIFLEERLYIHTVAGMFMIMAGILLIVMITEKRKGSC